MRSLMDGRAKQRLKLYLRSERAMGQPSVPAPPLGEAPQESGARPAYAEEMAAPRKQPVRSELFPGTLPKASVAGQQAVLKGMDARAPLAGKVLSLEQKKSALAAMDANEVKGCTRCRLCETRTNTVFGEGSAEARIFFIGEGPGENEDLTGRPFVGRAGQLLDKMIAGMGLSREQVFIANVVKCRPPGNRVPLPDEVATCTPYLERKLEIVRPEVIVTLGLPALKYMLNNTKITMGRMRGEWQEWRGIKLMPTFHPSYVLRTYTEEVRGAVWGDLQKVLVELGMPVPKRGKG
jgi:DNA polymerase